jgi:hypothetical protein
MSDREQYDILFKSVKSLVTGVLDKLNNLDKETDPEIEEELQNFLIQIDPENPTNSEALAAQRAANPDMYVPEIGQQLPGPKDPSGSTRSLVTDSYLFSTLSPSNWIGVDNEPDLLLNPYRTNNRMTGTQANQPDLDYPGMLGTNSLDYYDWSAPGTGVYTRSWEIDPSLLADGFGEYQRQTIEDVPFTISDAMGIFDAQTPEKQQQIAEGLALGQNGVNYMFEGVGANMFRNPEMIYNRNSVRQAFIKMGESASRVAQNLSGGFGDLGDEFIPDLDPQLSVGGFTDNLFEMAINAGAVARLDPSYLKSRGEQILPALTGLKVTPEYLDLIANWSESYQLANAGQSINTSNLDSFLVTKTEEEYADAIGMKDNRAGASSLGRALGVKRDY